MSTKVAIGEGKTKMECFSLCSEDISWQELSRALKPKLLSMLFQKRQANEAEKAHVENLVACLYCPYLTDIKNKVLVCNNFDCGRESWLDLA